MERISLSLVEQYKNYTKRSVNHEKTIFVLTMLGIVVLALGVASPALAAENLRGGPGNGTGTGVPVEQIEAIIGGEIPNRLMLVYDYCAENGLSFGGIKADLQAEVDKLSL